MKRLTYQFVLNNIDAVKAVFGNSPVFLSPQDGEYMGGLPFGHAQTFEPGGLHRLGVNTSGYFSYVVQGVELKWSFDLEGWGANGEAELQPRIDACRAVIGLLQGAARDEFRTWLVSVARHVRTEAAGWRANADGAIAKAAILAGIAGADA